jgi:hypothetical protein
MLNNKMNMKIIIAFFISISIIVNSYGSENEDRLFIQQIDTSLEKLIQINKAIKDIHPFLNEFHPIAIVKDDNYFIFDFDTINNKYEFIKKEPTSFTLPEKVRASFPLSCYNNRPSCIVFKDIFKTLAGYVTIFHEFMHCCQSVICESELKKDLVIAQKAMEVNDYMWELNHNFPYQDSLFVAYYTQFLIALDNDEDIRIKDLRDQLRQYLKPVDYEYMVWQEWKEGFARLIENKIRINLQLGENNNGYEKQYNRVTFYYGGAKFIDYLSKKNPELYLDIEMLFHHMK